MYMARLCEVENRIRHVNSTRILGVIIKKIKSLTAMLLPWARKNFPSDSATLPKLLNVETSGRIHAERDAPVPLPPPPAT
jgi:hypothetical protein